MRNRLAISVVICTHNRAYLLRHALESLATQTLRSERFEIVVVNNGSTDDTPTVVAQESVKRTNIQVRLVNEPVLGLGHARNRGWSCAQGRYVAFMDDDARADPCWLERALALFEQGDAAPIAVGGRILPFYPFPKPSWYKDDYEVRSWGNTSRCLSPGESFSGSNMIFTKAVLERVGGFDVSMGMRGERVSMGEETVLFRKLWDDLGPHTTILYSPHLVVYHAVGQQRMRPSHHLSRWFVAGQVASRLESPISWRERLRGLRMNWVVLRNAVRAAIQQRKQFSDRRVWMIEQGGPVALEVGRLLGRIGLYLSVRREKPSSYARNV